MKTIILITVFVFTVSNLLYAQNRNITIYYGDGSESVVDLEDSDSLVVFICGQSRVKYGSMLYNTVLIGEQCWLKENLNVGIRIDGSLDQTDNSPNYIEKYCYDDLESNCDIYGGLYQWDEAMQYVTTEGAQGICPDGWHIPTLADFQTLSTNVNNDGNALKAVGEGTGDGTGTDASGFSALLAGMRLPGFSFLHEFTLLWSSRIEVTDPYKLILVSNNSTIGISASSKIYGVSIRCKKN